MGCGKDFTILKKTLHILKSIQEAYVLKVLNLVKAAVTIWSSYQKQNIVSSGIRERQKQDHNLSKGDFHITVVKPFIHALIKEMKGTFDISNLPVLDAFLKLDPPGLPDRDSLLFESYSKEELKVLHDFYGTGKQDI